MGEYFKDHKLGTCSHLMYITREEVERFCGKLKGDDRHYLRRYLNLEHHFLYRFPRDGEHIESLSGIDRRNAFDYLRIFVPADFNVPHGDCAQVEMRSVNGWCSTYNLAFCPADPKHLDQFKPVKYCGFVEPVERLYNQEIDVVGNKYTPEQPEGYTLFRCPVCDVWFSCDEKDVNDVIIPILLKRGLKTEAKSIKPDRRNH